MAIRTLTKLLAGVQDMLWGRGVATQVRNGTSYNINRIQKIHPVDLLVDLKALPTLDEDVQYFEVIMKGTTGINDGNGGIFYFDAANTDAPDDLNTIRPDDRPSGPGRWIKQTSDSVLRTGDTMTGQLKGITPVAANDLTRKDYVDAAFNKHLLGPLATGLTQAYASDLDLITKNSVYSASAASTTNWPTSLAGTEDFVVITTMAAAAGTDLRVQELHLVQGTDYVTWSRLTTTGNAGWTAWKVLSADTLATLESNSNQASTAQGGTGASDGANTWAKLAEFTLADQHQVGVAQFALVGDSSEFSADLQFSVRLVANTVYDGTNSRVVMTHISPTSVVLSDGIKLVGATTLGSVVSLWINKEATNHRFYVKEIAKTGFSSITYVTDAPWQAAEPTGAFVVTSAASDFHITAFAPTAGTTHVIAKIYGENSTVASCADTVWSSVGVGTDLREATDGSIGFRCAVPGTVTCSVDHRCSASSSQAEVRILKNGSVVQTWSTTSTSFTTRRVDVPIDIGDIVLFQQRKVSGGNSVWTLLRVYSNTKVFAVA